MHQKKLCRVTFITLVMVSAACGAEPYQQSQRMVDSQGTRNPRLNYGGQPFSPDQGAFNTSSTNAMNRGTSAGYYNLGSAYAYPSTYYSNQTWRENTPPAYQYQEVPVNPPPRLYNQNFRAAVPPIENRPIDQPVPSTMNFTESQFVASLSSLGRSIYLGLDSQGKSLALQLAGEGGYQNKELAVKEAQRRMNERNGAMFKR